MKVIPKQNTVKVEGSLESSKIGINADKMDEVAAFFRDRIYTDKPTAALRETLCNSFDEHVKYGIEKLVDVHLPTPAEPYFSARDYAKGLSKDDVFDVFFTLLASKKREDKVSIGGFGVGSSAPHSYVDTFTVTSYFEGEKSVYVGINHGRECIAHRQSSEPSDEPSGIDVSFEVKDIYTFERKFAKFYQYFQNYGTFNVINPVEAPKIEVAEGKLYSNRGNNVLYKGILYSHPYKLCSTDIQLKIPDHVTLVVHISRERLEDVGVSETAITTFYDKYRAQMIQEFEANYPSDLAGRWSKLSSNEIDFLHTIGLDRAKYPKMRDFVMVSSNCNAYKLSGYKRTKIKRDFSIYSGEVVVFINYKTLGESMADFLSQKYNRPITVIPKSDICPDFDSCKKFLESQSPYAVANLVDGSSYVVARKPRDRKIISDNISIFDFQDNWYRRAYKNELTEITYWAEVSGKELTNKNLDKNMLRVLSTKRNVVGVAKTNIKLIPEHWVKVEKIVGSLRRFVNSRGMPPKEMYSPVPFEFSAYVNAQVPNNTWMPRAKRLKRAGKAKLEKHNKFVDKLQELRDGDFETNMALAMVKSYGANPIFITKAQELIKNKVKNIYENI